MKINEADIRNGDFDSVLKLDKIGWMLSEDGTYYEADVVYHADNDIPEEISSRYQYMKIYVPAEYIGSDGSVLWDAACGRHTAKSAPVIFKNNCMGWNSSEPKDANSDWLKLGWIHVECGARSRNADPEHNIHSKSPCQVVDLKSGIRMLRLNKDLIPGDMERIISYGFSGGGQMSSMIGATGNMEAYYPMLWDNGAAGVIKHDDGTFESSIRDDVYGCMCFCPIASIHMNSTAVSWIRFDSDADKPYTEFERRLDHDMAVRYCDYINSLELKDENGGLIAFDTDPESGAADPRKGSYYQKILSNISDSLNAFYAARDRVFPYIVRHGRGPSASSTEYKTFEEFYALKGSPDWAEGDGENIRFRIPDFADFYRGIHDVRMKGIPAFDGMVYNEETGMYGDGNGTTENNAFGRPGQCAVHFSPAVGQLLKDNYEEYSALEGFDRDAVDRFIEESLDPELARQLYLMDSTQIMLDAARGKTKACVAPKWRIRMGTDDQSSFAVPYNFALAAREAGADVDYHLVWAMGHGIREGVSTGTFAQWVEELL